MKFRCRISVRRKGTTACWQRWPASNSARTATAVVDASRKTWHVIEEATSLKRMVPAKVFERRRRGAGR
jgi:hypothetical protein